MELDFQRPRAEDSRRISAYYTLRDNKSCDSGVLDTYLWSAYYDTRIAEWEDKALLMLMRNGEEFFSAMPYCSEEELYPAFKRIESHFNNVLGEPLKIYLADEEGVRALGLMDNPEYIVREEPDFRDYIYDAEQLRTLPGRRFHKKKNLVNKFKKEYEGRWEYRTLCCEDKMLVWDFLDRWYKNRPQEDEGNGETLEYEIQGIHEILKNCFLIDYKVGGIFIDGNLEAFSMGSYNPREKMACIAIEKGNPLIPGIYQIINQQFLLNEFPMAVLVNREDDMGIPGLRHAKESYNPLMYEKKYFILQKFRGYEKYMRDVYEDELISKSEEEKESG